MKPGVVSPDGFGLEYRGTPFLMWTCGGSTSILESVSAWPFMLEAGDPLRRSIEGTGELFLINEPVSPLLLCGVGISDGGASLKSLFMSSKRTPRVSG